MKHFSVLHFTGDFEHFRPCNLSNDSWIYQRKCGTSLSPYTLPTHIFTSHWEEIQFLVVELGGGTGTGHDTTQHEHDSLNFRCWLICWYESQSTTQDLQEPGASSFTPCALRAVSSSVNIILLFSRTVVTQLDAWGLPKISKVQWDGGTTHLSHAAMGMYRLQPAGSEGFIPLLHVNHRPKGTLLQESM